MSAPLEEALNQRLKSFAGLAALVGNKIYPLIASAKAIAPYLVYTQVSKKDMRCLQRSRAMSRYRFQFSCYAKEYVQAKALARQVVAALETWDGAEASFQDDENDSFDESAQVYLVDIDCFLWYR